jgi:two-component sensor histidine kinase
MYFGVALNGLVIYDVKSKEFNHLTRSQGLPDNNILSLCLQKNKLWIATENGLASYNIETKKIFSFTAADGIPTDPHVIYSLYYDSAYQQLYGAFKNTIFRFNPDSLAKNNSPPFFFIESLVAGNYTIFHPAGSIALSYQEHNIIMHLGSVNFEDAYQQQFAYRVVKNSSEPWQEIGSQTDIIFNNLPAGNHRIQVKVYIRNHNWQEQVKEINIYIRPPFWKTLRFFALMFLLIGGMLFYLHRRRIRQVEQKANLDKLLAQTEMKALHSQMNPHFIFNCLNSIREMILNNDNRQASRYLSKFAQLIRITLDNSTKHFISLKHTIDYLQRYLEMEKIRTDHFIYTIEVNEELEADDIFLPPMLIQPFIENAIWHGQQPNKSMLLTIQFQKKKSELICIVEDDGIGIETSLKHKNATTHRSFGIANIRHRIQLLNEKYHIKSTVLIEDKSVSNEKNGTGTKVTLHLPLKNTEL